MAAVLVAVVWVWFDVTEQPVVPEAWSVTEIFTASPPGIVLKVIVLEELVKVWVPLLATIV